MITIAGAERGFADGSAASARFADPTGIAVDGSGNILVADATNSLLRFVDVELAAGDGLLAVTTLAGTGDRGHSDGAGDTARFFTPRGVVVTESSAIIVADTGNHVLRRILLPPAISSITPPMARPSETVVIEGERFDGRSPDRNIVRFAGEGGSQLQGQVIEATRTELTVIVPEGAVSGPVIVETEGGTSNAVNFEVIAGPTITSFNPQSGQVGTEVTLTGTELKAETGPVAVTFAGSNNTRLQALVTFASETQVRAIVPNGAVTGHIELTNALGSAMTASPFTVEPGEEDFQLTVAPTVASAVERASATYIVYVTSPLATFSQLVYCARDKMKILEGSSESTL